MVAYQKNLMNMLVILLMVSYLTFGYVSLSTDGNDCMQYRMIEKLTYLENENSKLMDRISQLEQQMRPVVSVYVRLSKSVNVKLHERVMYDMEITNIGGAFNFKTGQLTAPVSGVYFISVSACLFHAQYSNLDIIKDGLKIGVVRSGDLEWVDCSSGNVIFDIDRLTFPIDKLWGFIMIFFKFLYISEYFALIAFNLI
jgi:hypothetical protein